MRRHLGFLGLLCILACGIKGPPRPPLKAKGEAPASPVETLREEAPEATGEQHWVEEKLTFEEELK